MLLRVHRRAKRLLMPTEDGDLVLLFHLMTAGRLRYLRAGESGPKTPAFRLEFQGGSQLVLTEAGAKKRAGVWLLTPEQAQEELAHLGPEAFEIGVERLVEICASESRRLHSLLRDQRAIAGIGRAWANEILHRARLSPYALSTDLAFASYEGSDVEYFLEEGRIMRTVSGGPARGMSAMEVSIDLLRFYRVGSGPHPLVVVIIKGHIGDGRRGGEFSLQTAVTPRTITN
jgi:formamidopyrimidine-DNA glycosylase